MTPKMSLKILQTYNDLAILQYKEKRTSILKIQSTTNVFKPDWHPNLREKDPDQGAETVIKVGMDAENYT